MTDGIIAQVLRWLRAGYPDGVPPKDYTPLLALLRRSLTDQEFEAVIAEIERANPDPVRLQHIRGAISTVSHATPDADELQEVAARLLRGGIRVSEDVRRVAAGELPENVSPFDGAPKRGGLIAQVLGWLQVGYPQGVPPKDRVPLLALARRRLTDDEVHEVARALAQAGDDATQTSAIDAKVLMTKLLDELPAEEDVERVRAHLERCGCDLD